MKENGLLVPIGKCCLDGGVFVHAVRMRKAPHWTYSADNPVY